MTSILYGNLRAEVAGRAGSRIQRVGVRPAAAARPAYRQPGVPARPLMLGRDREAAEAFAAITEGQHAGFYAPCGYGKTTLLRYLVATAAERRLAPGYAYLRADGDRVGDLLQDLMTRLYVFDEPVKPTPQECAQLLGQVSAIVAIDDLSVRDDQLDCLLQILPGCRLVIGSAQPVLGRRGRSRQLDGLPDDSALALIASRIGRQLTGEEIAAARSLVAAVDGQPLHLRQCAALAREGRHTLGSLARQAAGDPGILDQLSISALARQQRRALAALALTAGTLLPADVVDAIGQASGLAQWLQSLHECGLAEQREDRFGLPACKGRGYRELLLRDLDLAVAARGLSNWLTAADPTADDSKSAAEAALTMMEFAAERGEWTSVAQLAQAAERVMFLAGRWEAWHDTLSRGLDAARATADKGAEAFFLHQQGTLAFCQDQLEDAYRLLGQALNLRELIGDAVGADVTRHNLSLLSPPDQPPPRRPRVSRRVLQGAGGFLGTMALVAATVLITGVLRGPTRADNQSNNHPTAPASSASRPASPSGSTAASPGQSLASSGPLIAQVISFTSTPPSPAVARETYAVTAAGGDSGNRVALRIAPGSASVCSMAAGIVTFGRPGMCVIDADQAGNATYQPAPEAQQAITVAGISQSIRFTAPAQGQAGQSVTLTASGGSSGQLVKFSVDPASSPGVCAVSGTLGAALTYDAAGQCVIDANQAGNAQYQAAPQVQQVITVNGASQSITFTSEPPASPAAGSTYAVTATGGPSGNQVTFTVDASSTSAACAISRGIVTFGQLGRCVIDANQAGNAQYQAAPQVQQVIAVDGVPQSIAFTAPASGQVGQKPVTLRATGGGSGNPVKFSVDTASDPGACAVSGANGATLSYAAIGHCVIDANQQGASPYLPAPQVQRVTGVTGIPQLIRFTPPAPGFVGQAIPLRATGGKSGNPVVFTVDPVTNPKVCSVSAPDGKTPAYTLHYAAPGTCVIDANQAGNTRYQAAPQVEATIVVSSG